VTAAEALDRYRRSAGPKPASIVERYLRWGGTNADAVLGRYLRHLEQEGLGPGTVDLHRRTIRAFYRQFGLPAPTARGWRYDPKDARRPALAADLVLRLITAARAGDLTGRQACLLALATTYGMRAVELAAIRPSDVDPEGERIYIRTAKGGQPRWCWLPPQIIPWLPAVWPSASPNSVEKTFGNLWGNAVDAERPARANWHAVRRALVRDLVAAGVPEGAVARFLRWSGGGSRGPERMVALYSSPTEQVGAEGVSQVRAEDAGQREYDRDVWDHHPYLRHWSP